MKEFYPLGILAGMGPYSTAPFINNVLNACRKLYGAKSDIDFPHLIIYSLPTPYHPEDNSTDTEIVKCLEMGINSLIKVGAKIIAVPCNSVHRFYDEMKKISSVPVLNIIDETVSKVQSNKAPVCILATRSTIEAELYQSKLKSQQKEIFWNEELQKYVDSLIASLKAVGLNEVTLNIWKNIENILRKNNVNEIIIGCTDLFFCAEQSRTLKFYDSSVFLAEKLVKEYMANTKIVI